jgi:hypothetical protein
MVHTTGSAGLGSKPVYGRVPERVKRLWNDRVRGIAESAGAESYQSGRHL